jgi:catechol 2,3-dioxygenase-like lactoylglutathione lyase family enzyme
MMPGLHHVGYWVDDLDSALTRWGQHLGVGPFQVIQQLPFEEFVLTDGGQPGEHLPVGGRLPVR